MDGLAVVSWGQFCESFGIATGLGPFRPSVTLAVQTDAFKTQLKTTAPKLFRAVPFVQLCDTREQRTDGRQSFEQRFDRLSETEMADRSGLSAAINDYSPFPIDIISL